MIRKYTARLLIALALAGSAWLPTLSATTPALAFNCGSGYQNQQQDNFYNPAAGYYWHGWLGLCDGFGVVYYYGGEDSRYSWGGSYHAVSGMSVRLRAWSCGSLYYDNTASNSGQAFIQLVSSSSNPCLYQADVSGHEWVNNGPGWYWYLKY